MHYTCLIITDNFDLDVELIVANILAPFSEDIKVAPYDRDCICVTNKRFKKLVSDSDTPCPSCNGKGSTRSTYNPDAKWDYYEIGGRWDKMFGGNIMPVNKLLQVERESLANEIFAVLEPDGTWHEACPLFDLDEEQAAEWPEELIAILTKHENSKAILCDLHI